ncbi:MAG: magnesium/cobalt transporter CorA [Candidatus Zixiibacteriota bacterium]|nr:MAG: magnesium/cobalt transporter CorA [candidate division Zixibacteria bacterium]
MAKRVSRVSKKLGLKPGSVVYVGAERTEEVKITIIDYTETEYQEKTVSAVEECFPFKDSPTISWINVDGIHDTHIVEQIGSHFGMHPLVLEDIVNTGQRPKMEDAGEYLMVAMKMLYRGKDNDELKSEQVSVLFGANWVMTFQETGEDVFDIVRQRIKKTVPRVRFMTSDYLAYALIDAVVDHYFIILESIGEKIENLEDEMSEYPKPDSLETIRNLKKQLIFMRKAVWPLREVIGGMERTESKLIIPSTEPYLRDLYEHIIQVIDTVETYRDMVSGLLDLYHTGVSNRMNEVMKVLTIFATIFIPLGFLAGVYGMNFDTGISPFNLPELGFRYGYLFFWGLVIIVAGGLLWFFKRKKWL